MGGSVGELFYWSVTRLMKEKPSQPSLEIRILLRSRQAQKMHLWLSRQCGDMFFMLEVVFSDRQYLYSSVVQTSEQITTELQSLEKSLLNYLYEIPEEACSKTIVSYSSPKEVIINCGTPQAKCCASLLENYDLLVQHCDRQWLLGKSSREARKNEIHDWTATISRTINRCSRLYWGLRQEMINSQRQNSQNKSSNNTSDKPKAGHVAESQ